LRFALFKCLFECRYSFLVFRYQFALFIHRLMFDVVDPNGPDYRSPGVCRTDSQAGVEAKPSAPSSSDETKPKHPNL
jgi:hypothetical protein